MTTNGVLLRRHARDWRAAGLTALNVSVDSLDRGRFAEITGHDRLDDILAGVEDALALGFDSVKLNAVLLRGLNDDDLPAWQEYLRERDLAVRFIELMQTGDNRDYFERHHVRAEFRRRGSTPVAGALPRAADAEPAIEYAHPNYAGRIGVIAPYARDFCASCNRLRVTARGDLRLCLFGEVGIPLRPLLQEDAQHELLCATISRQISGIKRDAHRLHQGQTGLVPHLASIGG